MGGIVKAVSSLFPQPKMPKLKPVAMPDPGSTQAKIAAQKKVQSRNKGGRESTNLTGGIYSGQNLAGTA